MRWLVVVLIMVSVAGCTDKSEGPAQLTMESCMEQGLILGELNGKAECVEEGAPAQVYLNGIPESASAYTKIPFGWNLQTHRAEAHAMMTQVRVSSVTGEGLNLSSPDTWGVELAKAEHQDFTSAGINYTGIYKPTEPGKYYLRAYAEVVGQHLWSEEFEILVTGLVGTGNTTTGIIQLGALAAGLADGAGTLSMMLGDDFVIQNDDIPDYAFSVSGPSTIPDFTASGQSSSMAIMPETPGSYTFTGTPSNNLTTVVFTLAVNEMSG